MITINPAKFYLNLVLIFASHSTNDHGGDRLHGKGLDEGHTDSQTKDRQTNKRITPIPFMGTEGKFLYLVFLPLFLGTFT